jgi:hypothetical protein
MSGRATLIFGLTPQMSGSRGARRRGNRKHACDCPLDLLVRLRFFSARHFTGASRPILTRHPPLDAWCRRPRKL